MVNALKGLAPDLDLLGFPPWDCLPYDTVSPSREVMGQRMAVLHRMAAPAERARVLVTSPAAIVQRVPPRSLWKHATFGLRTGDRFDQGALEGFLHRCGYVLDDRVDEPGEAAIHGQVIDLFPANGLMPFRVEHDGAAIVSIRRYHPLSQRTEEEVGGITLGPASEVVLSETGNESAVPQRTSGMEHRLPEYYERMETLFDYWPDAPIVVEEKAGERRLSVVEQIADAHESRISLRMGADHAVRPERLYITEDEWRDRFAERSVTFLHDTPKGGSSAVPFFASSPRPAQELSEFVGAQRQAGCKIVLCAADERDRRRMHRRIQKIGPSPNIADAWSGVLAGPPQSVWLIEADIKDGFIDEAAGVAVVTAHDVFGSRAKGAGASDISSAEAQLTDVSFHLGDTVIHLEHGIGRLEGIETVSLESGRTQDAIRLVYADEAKLMVPTDEMDKIWRYGAAMDVVRLDKLNGSAWIDRRQKIEAEVQDSARALKALVRERKARRSEPIVPPGREYERFIARFAFTETSDQLQAIEEVLQDLASGRPMDRLVCGDVGFGKTEVALRAAAAVAFSGKQVAIVAPTTVLARQHLRTFERRFAGFGLRIAHLSRLVAPAEARAVKIGLADGTIRIVVGTHALVGKGITFKDLGLVVVDEEQRFGAAHKSKLRQMGDNGHVLTLTATPIPRTLQSSLVGLQDVSIIATPPARRQPIRTFLTSFDPAAVRDALMREKRRGGQSFVVCPRIRDIAPMQAQLSKLVPELDLIAAHGEMPPAEIDEAMVRFADGEGDVLLATNIIESGLDVPRANTMLVWRADRFGLAQLHQLRGRVGRGRIRGTAYLLTEPDRVLPKATEKRLRTLEALDRLGAGFAISEQDLDQRGAGSLLGEEQAGHVKLIGTDLYQFMLRHALQGESIEDAWRPELNIGLLGSIPEDYINDPEIRINLYARITRFDPAGRVDALEDEIADRFGALPQPVQNLISLVELKQICLRLRIARIDAGPQGIAFSFRPEASERLSPEKAINVSDEELRWNGERLILARAIKSPEDRLDAIRDLLDKLPRGIDPA
ncbi:MAG TPA: transcription-repair coupling factor [Microvirga sp.]|nr:transcription-repair coupling factor [Microvirga sp.]